MSKAKDASSMTASRRSFVAGTAASAIAVVGAAIPAKATSTAASPELVALVHKLNDAIRRAQENCALYWKAASAAYEQAPVPAEIAIADDVDPRRAHRFKPNHVGNGAYKNADGTVTHVRWWTAARYACTHCHDLAAIANAYDAAINEAKARNGVEELANIGEAIAEERSELESQITDYPLQSLADLAILAKLAEHEIHYGAMSDIMPSKLIDGILRLSGGRGYIDRDEVYDDYVIEV